MAERTRIVDVKLGTRMETKTHYNQTFHTPLAKLKQPREHKSVTAVDSVVFFIGLSSEMLNFFSSV